MGGALSAAALGVGATALAPWTSARLIDGNPPEIQIHATGGGEVFLEADVDETGAVTGTTLLRTTPPFAASVRDAVARWRFAPAREVAGAAPEQSGVTRAVRSKIAVLAIFRPPALFNGTTLGEAPKNVAAASDTVPIPLGTSMPPFPSRALNSGVVLLEVDVSSAGVPTKIKAVRSAPPFDEPAVATVRQWRFRPARYHGAAIDGVTYVIVGFRQPIT
jgi:TonB family protein